VKVESVIVRDLVPWVDRTFRTVADRRGRILEGFSMGGYGAARLGLAHHELFGAVSMIGAGPMQDNLLDAPRAGRERARTILARVYGNDPEFFRSVSPRAIATRSAAALKDRLRIRMIVGTRDETFGANEQFHRDLERLGLSHSWRALPDVAHDMPATFEAMGAEFFAFHREFLGAGTPREGTIRFTVNGAARQAIVVNAPKQGQPPRATVLALHGGGGSAEQLRRFSGFDALARAEGFMVVYPQGTEFQRGMHAWNTGYLMRRAVGTVDDVAYFDALIDRLIEHHGADPARVYMTGASNGGMMTFVYACKRAVRLAGIAPIVGAMFTFDEKPARPVPTLIIVGGKDDEVPIEGGMSRNILVRRAQEAPYKPVAETLAFWARANNAAAEAQVEKQGSLTTTTHAAQGEASAIARLVLDAEGGHGWPGTPARRGGNTPITSFKGADFVWQFFKDHAGARRAEPKAEPVAKDKPEAQPEAKPESAARAPEAPAPR
jgi:poly(3-hydroxybutyrate) depolymerase